MLTLLPAFDISSGVFALKSYQCSYSLAVLNAEGYNIMSNKGFALPTRTQSP